MSARRVPPRDWFHRPEDVRRYVRRAQVWMLTLYGCLTAAMLGLVALIWLVPLIALAYARGALLTHELMHIRRVDQVPRLLRPMMLFDTPFGLGYREYRAIHLRHHRHAGTADDPEHYQIAGGPLRALAGAFLASEIAMLHWLRREGLSAELRREAAGRGLLFCALLVANPPVFATWWLVMRGVVGASNFAFHHAVHARGRRLGQFRFATVAPLDALLRLALGRALYPVLFDHPAHHVWPQVRAAHLPGLLEAFPATHRAS